MRTLLLQQPWATLAARGAARFFARNAADAYRGTVAIMATADMDGEAVARLASDREFAERLASLGLRTTADIEALPRSAIVGVAVVADIWSLESLEEVASEEDAILLGDVDETSLFVELAEPVLMTAIAIAPDVAPSEDAAGEDEEPLEEEVDEPTSDTPTNDVFAPLDEDLLPQVRSAALAAGARFDDEDLVYWPVVPSPSLATLIGNDAVGDREITRRIWAYIAEQDLQDPEDHSYVYFDDALREAFDTDVEGLSTVVFSERIAQQVHLPDVS